MKYLQHAIELAQKLQTTNTTKTADDLVYEAAVATVDAVGGDTPTPADSSDKGLFGNRQVEFVQEVYYLPESPAGDHSQPIGLLTQSDLNNYCFLRKNDRLSFVYRDGTSGNCTYDAKKNGQEEFSSKIDWSDALIQELIDEGACKLI